MGRRRRIVQGIIVFVLLLLCGSAAWWISGRGGEQATGPGSGASATAAATAASSPAAPDPNATAAAQASAASEPLDAGSGPSTARAEWRGSGGPSEAAGSNLGSQSRGSDDQAPAPTAAATAEPSATALASAAPPDAGADAAAPPPTAVASPTPPVLAPPPGLAAGRFRNRVGSTYRLLGVTCVVDGAVAYQGSAADAAMFNLQLSPGNHTVSVAAEYEGAGGGVFTYLNGYRFKVTTGRAFPVRSGETARVTVTAFERGGATTKYEERLSLAVDVR